jgi:hypothetical protein
MDQPISAAPLERVPEQARAAGVGHEHVGKRPKIGTGNECGDGRVPVAGPETASGHEESESRHSWAQPISHEQVRSGSDGWP